jgi:CheY-like chemotaxis protein
MPRLLIIEDDVDMREAMALILAADGNDVRVAANGREGLKALAGDWRPDLILIDLMMPIMNGRQFREAQLADPAIAAIPVVLLSGHHEITDQARLLKPAACLQKPFSIPDLLKVVETGCGTPA